MTELGLESKIKYALENGPIIIYGAHLVAVELYRYLKQLNLRFSFAGFVVTSLEGNPEELEREKVRELQSFQIDRDVTVMIAMPEKYHDEVEAYARTFGFSSFIRVSLEEMSKIKGRYILRYSKRYKELSFNLYEDDYDTSWINMGEPSTDLSRQKCSLARRHYKFPTLYYLDSETVFQEVKKFNFYMDYERILGTYHNLHDFPVRTCILENKKEENATQKLLKVYMVFSQWDRISVSNWEASFWIYPIQAGSALTEKKRALYLDETGDSISEMNRVLAEMTAAYWIWKNAGESRYKGLCHYRRHFVLMEEEVISLERNGIDVILTTPRYVPGGLKQMFLAETPVKEEVFQMMVSAVSEYHPKEVDKFIAYLDEYMYYPNNMVIAKSEIYDEYCEWIFPVLFRMMEIDEEKGYKHKKDRHVAYAAEILTSWFFVRKKNRYCIAVTDYQFYS